MAEPRPPIAAHPSPQTPSPTDPSPTDPSPTGESRWGRRPSKPPSPPWYGAVSVTLLGISVLWTVLYSFGVPPGTAALGGWNYAVALGFFLGTTGMAHFWRGG